MESNLPFLKESGGQLAIHGEQLWTRGKVGFHSSGAHPSFIPKPLHPNRKGKKKKMPPSSQRIPYEASATKRKDEEAILNPVTTNVFGELSPLFLIN